MQIDSGGHVVNEDGSTTEPMKTPYWVGDNNQRITFDRLLMDDGYIAIHSIYGSIEDQLAEDFLYEVVTANEAKAVATSMVNDAMLFLYSKGVKDMSNHTQEFLLNLVGKGTNIK